MAISHVQLSKLPYELDALEGSISRDTLSTHYSKHHAGYVKKTNLALDRLRTLDQDSSVKHVLKDLSFNLNGHILHELYWRSMTDNEDHRVVSEKVKSYIEEYYDSFKDFKERFTLAATSVEGSGWCALLKSPSGELQIMQIENHNKLYPAGYKIVMIIDMWEHAYYLDYKNDRAAYISNWWNIVNWSFVESQLD